MKDQEWDIKARADVCADCEKGFEDKETFCSMLSFGEEGYLRADYCEPCWEKADKATALSVWRSVFLLPPPPPEEALKKETAESLLRQLIEKEDPTHRNTIYILAVMLERRRLLVEQDVQVREDGVKVRVYEYKKTGEVFLVPDPELNLAELEQVQEEVVVMLGGKPRNAEESPSAEASAKADGQASEGNEDAGDQEEEPDDEEDAYDDDDEDED